ncbi:MAG: hypothetical protein WCH39_19050, partial [Schlesneria sp.]
QNVNNAARNAAAGQGGGVPVVPVNNQNAAQPVPLTSSQLQALKAQFGPLTYIGSMSLTITRAYRPYCNLYKDLAGSTIYVSAKTGQVVRVVPAANTVADSNYYWNNPSRMDPSLQISQNFSFGVASAAAGTAGAMVAVPGVIYYSAAGLAYVGVPAATATATATVWVNGALVTVTGLSLVQMGKDTWRAASRGDWNTVAFNSGVFAVGFGLSVSRFSIFRPVGSAGGNPGRVVQMNPRDLRFSQNTAGGGGRAALLRQSMKNGWNGPAVDAVQTAGGIVTLDNTRIAIAREFGINNVPVTIHLPSDPLPKSMLGRFGNAKTWGEALKFRTGQQRPPLPPTGTSSPPRIPN